MLRFGSCCTLKSFYRPLMQLYSPQVGTKSPLVQPYAGRCNNNRQLQIRSISQTNGCLGKNFSFMDWFLMSPKKPAEKQKGPYNSRRKRFKIKEPFKLHQLDEGPQRDVQLTREEAKLYYTQLQTIRHVEEASEKLYGDSMQGFSRSLGGREACAVGLRAGLRSNDKIITAQRSHSWSYLMGVSPLTILGEMAGRRSGCASGNSDSMHMYAPRFYGANGILGAQVPIGAGMALASKLKRDGGACLAIYGDFYAQRSQIFESYNKASQWKLPCVFVCENNISGPCRTCYYSRGGVVPGILVDGTDVLAVRQATKFAIDYAVEKGPMMLELNTVLNAASPAVKAVMQQQRDPITIFRRTCVDNNILTVPEVREIDRAVRLKIDFAIQKVTENTNGRRPVRNGRFGTEQYADAYAGSADSTARHAVASQWPQVDISREQQKYHSGEVLKRARAFETRAKLQADRGSQSKIRKVRKFV